MWPTLAELKLQLGVTSSVKAPDAPYGVATVFDTGGFYVARQHPNYQLLLVGQRSSFGVA
jgi:hypothetical protein